MSVFVSTTYLGDGSNIQSAINQLEKQGISKIELGSNHSRCDLRSLKLRSNSQYIAHNYFPEKDPNFVLNLASQESQVREASINFVKNTIKICARLNIKFYTIHPGFLGEASISRPRKEARNLDFKFKKNKKKFERKEVIISTLNIIKNLYKLAKINNVKLLIENEGSKTSKDFVIFSTDQELDLLQKAIGKDLKFNFNLAHATLAGIDLNDRKIFNHFYKISDFFEVSEIEAIYDSHKPIFEGSGTIENILKKYAQKFSKKNIILEYRNLKIEKLASSYRHAKNLLNPLAPII